MRIVKTNNSVLINTCQTLVNQQPERVEMPAVGHDKGSFVAIEAIKAN